MTREELLQELEKIEKEFSALPEEMKWLEVDVPMMIRDPNDPKKMIKHPKGRVTQRRMDIIDAKDPRKEPLLHYHIYPDHPIYNPDFLAHGNLYIKVRPTVFFLTQNLKEILNGTSME